MRGPTVIIAVARPSNLDSAGGVLSSSLLPPLRILCPFSRPPVVLSQKLIRRRSGALEILGFLFAVETLRRVYKRIKCPSRTLRRGIYALDCVRSLAFRLSWKTSRGGALARRRQLPHGLESLLSKELTRAAMRAFSLSLCLSLVPSILSSPRCQFDQSIDINRHTKASVGTSDPPADTFRLAISRQASPRQSATKCLRPFDSVIIRLSLRPECHPRRPRERRNVLLAPNDGRLLSAK